MRINSMKIAAMKDGIEVPDGTQVDDEFELVVRVKVFRVERELIDVSTFEGPDAIEGALHMDLIAL